MTTTQKNEKALKGNQVKVKTSQRQSKSGKTNKKNFPKISTGGLPTTTTHDLSKLFFESPTSRPDGIFQPLLFGVGRLLQEKGVSHENLKSALMIFTAINSPKLGYSLSLQLMPEDPLLAISLLDHCVSLAPIDSTIEFQKLKPEHLFINPGFNYQNKCIVCPDENGFSKVYPDIKFMLTRGHTTRQEIVNKKFDIGLVEYKAKWPISFIGVASGKKGGDLNHPAMLKVPVKSNPGLIEQTLPAIIGAENGVPVPILRNRIAFERLKHRPVEIPFANQLMENFVSAGGDHIDIKMMILVKMISICSIINQPDLVTKEELGAYIYKTDEETVRKWLYMASNDQVKINPKDVSISPLTATKVDYYLARLLLDGLLSTGDNYLTERQRKIFEVVKRINMGKLGTAFLKKKDDIEMLATIARGSGYWATREKVFEEVNKAGSIYMSPSTVNNVLVDLVEMEFLDRSKPPRSRHYGYYVMMLNLDSPIVLPHPSEINDPIYKGKPVEVINPLTGQTDKI
jgi:hypothetical protein